MDTSTGRIFAVKKSNFDATNTIADDSRYCEVLREELSICKDLRHPNIVSYLGHGYGKDGHLYIYLDYVSGGSMTSLLREFGPLRGSALATATRGLAGGLNYLHSQRPPVVHRDIKGG